MKLQFWRLLDLTVEAGLGIFERVYGWVHQRRADAEAYEHMENVLRDLRTKKVHDVFSTEK